jgi:hypothetical protein
VIRLAAKLVHQVGNILRVAYRHRPLHADPQVPQPVQSLAQPVTGQQVDADHARHGQQHVAARHLGLGKVGQHRDRGGEAEPGVDHPAELVGAGADEPGFVGTRQRQR